MRSLAPHPRNLKDDMIKKIADIGCGSGAQIITLNQKIKTLKESMDNLSFASEEFDIIWSEGAVYIMGFEEGIKDMIILKLLRN